MTPDVKDFPALVRWLADTYHRGTIMRVGESVGLSPATAQKWVAARATPTIEKLSELCDAYGLDFHKVVDLVRATKRIKRAVVVLLAALLGVSTVSTGSAAANPTPDGWNLSVRNAPYRHLRALWERLTHRCASACGRPRAWAH